MNLQQGIQSRVPANGFNRRRFDRDVGPRIENKLPAKSVNGSKGSSPTSPSRDRLIYVSTCLIGLHVEVHVKNGSIFSGIFSSINSKDFGIVLKMAQLVKEGSGRGQKGAPERNKRPQTIIIPAKEFVQIIAKDVSLSCDELSSTISREKRKDLMIDSVISRSHYIESARELERWTPDADDPECPELDNIFDGTWNRNWDQFEINETLFGVKSTFDEELYTTKLVRGPQMREIEREASRIAREIEGEDTHDFHLAEERGTHFHEDYDIDEESRYSAVQRQHDDGRLEENDFFSNSLNTETFDGSASSEFSTSFSSFSQEKKVDEGKTSSTYSSLDAEILPSCASDNGEDSPGVDILISSLATDDAKKCANDSSSMRQDLSDQLAQDQHENRSPLLEKSVKVSREVHTLKEDENKESRIGSSDILPSNKSPVHIKLDNLFPVSSPSCISVQVAAASTFNGPTLSTSSSLSSSSSERSTLNPNAKEFKLNPNAKSFTPSLSFRSSVPMSEGSLYFTNAVPTVPPMQSMPIGVGIGPPFGAHQTVYNTQAPQLQPSPYIQANGPMYGAQMIVGQPQPFYYLPTYSPELQYRGRSF